MVLEYIIPDRVYSVLKWLGLVALPAVAVFISTIGPSVGMGTEDQNAAVTVLNGLGVLIGVLIGASQATGKPTEGEDA